MKTAASVGGINVSRETIDRLRAYESLVRKWNPTVNLVARSTLGDLWGRHIEDSAQLFRYFDSSDGKIADLGSGGGFPGVVLAVLAVERSQKSRFDLVESDGRKAAFLATVVRELSLSAMVHNIRAEFLPDHVYDVVTSRALASLDQLTGLASNLLKPGGKAVFPKGRNHAQEQQQALENWRFSVQKHDSLTAHDAVVFVIKDITRV